MTKKKEIKLPAIEESKHPLRNFLVLLFLIPLAPIILLFSIITGRLQNPFITGACLTMIIAFGGYYAYNKYFNIKAQTINEKLAPISDELTGEERSNLKNEVSTLRKEIGEDKLPKSLKPMLDINLNMITINYFYFLVNSGHIGADGNGAVYILQNGLYSGNYKIMKAAWESLYYVNSDDSKRVMAIFTEDVAKVKAKQAKNKEQVAEQLKNKKLEEYKPSMPPKDDIDLMKDDFDKSILNLRFKMNKHGLNF
jgi:hypothetical protein